MATSDEQGGRQPPAGTPLWFTLLSLFAIGAVVGGAVVELVYRVLEGSW